MIIDKVDGQNIPRYLVYDVVAFEGFDVGKQPFYPNRCMLIEVSTKYTIWYHKILVDFWQLKIQ